MQNLKEGSKIEIKATGDIFTVDYVSSHVKYVSVMDSLTYYHYSEFKVLP